MMADGVLPVRRINILIPQLTVGDFVTDDEVGRLQNPVRDHDRRPFLAFPTGKATKFGAEIRLFGVACGVGTCDEDRPGFCRKVRFLGLNPKMALVQFDRSR
jgi:hypothetical protein